VRRAIWDAVVEACVRWLVLAVLAWVPVAIEFWWGGAV